MAELKPCPFCGGKPGEPYYYDPFDGYQGDCGSYIVSCLGCGVAIRRRTKQEAIEAWNKRAETEEHKFIWQFIHEHGLEFAFDYAWERRKKDA